MENNVLKSASKEFTRSDGKTIVSVVTQAIPAMKMVGILKALREDPYEPKNIRELLSNTFVDGINCKEKFDDIFTGDMEMLDEVVDFVSNFCYPTKKSYYRRINIPKRKGSEGRSKALEPYYKDIEKNMDEELEQNMPIYRLIHAGMCTMTELWTTITYEDVMLMNAFLDVSSDLDALANSDIGINHGN